MWWPACIIYYSFKCLMLGQYVHDTSIYISYLNTNFVVIQPKMLLVFISYLTASFLIHVLNIIDFFLKMYEFSPYKIWMFEAYTWFLNAFFLFLFSVHLIVFSWYYRSSFSISSPLCILMNSNILPGLRCLFC